MNNSVKLNANNVRMIAHRGLSGLEPENTNAAFVAAGNRSYFGIETDIHLTRDGKFIVYHDDDLIRLTGVDWIVEEHPLEDLRSLRLKDIDGNERSDLVMPTLEEYIRICKKYVKCSVLELKNHFEREDIQNIIGIIQNEGWLDQTIFISFDLENLITLRQLCPSQKIQYLVRQIDSEVIGILNKYSFDVDVKWQNLRPEDVCLVHKSGHQVNVWTVNEAENGLKMAVFGVDYITSDILE